MNPPESSTMNRDDMNHSSAHPAAAVVTIATTPTGSTELLKSSSSSSSSDCSSLAPSCNSSDQENKDIVEASAESLALSSTGEIASMPFLIRRKKNKTNNAGTRTTSVPVDEHEERQASTPLMDSSTTSEQGNRTTPLLQLPLPPESKTPRRNKASPSNGTTASTPPSSIKNTILARKAQKYSSLKKRRAPNNILNRLFCNNGLETNASGDEDLDLEAQLPTARSTLSNDSTVFSPKQSQSCIQIGCDMIHGASENLTLHDEAIVRQTIQTNITAMTTPSPSHKTFAQLKQAFEEKSRSKNRASRDDDSTSIATPRMKISMVTDDLDDLASASSSLAKPRIERTKSDSPKRNKKSKEIGGVIIPPLFQNQPNSNKNSVKPIHFSPPQQKGSSSRSRSPVKKKESKKSPMGMSLTMSTASTAETSETSGSDHTSLPSQMIRVSSSMDDLSTVPEMSTSKETATRSLDENELNRQTLSLSSSKLSFCSSRDALARAQSELHNEFQNETIEEIRPTASGISPANSSSASKKTYETKINYLKDQVALANRLAKLRLDEIQRLESTMDEMRENQEQSDATKELNLRLDQSEKQKEEEIQAIKEEMEQRIAELKRLAPVSPSSRSSSSPEQVVKVQKELHQAKTKLEENLLDVELESQLHTLTEELATVKRELAKKARELTYIRKVNEELAVSSSRSMSETEELLRVKKELADVTEQLANASLLPRTDDERLDTGSGRPPIATSKGIRSRSLSPGGLSRTRLQQDNDRLAEENDKLQTTSSANHAEIQKLRNEIDRLNSERSKVQEQSDLSSKSTEAIQKRLQSYQEEAGEASKERDELSLQLIDIKKKHQEEKNEMLQENSKLRDSLEEYCAVEEAMQITSNEQEQLREQLQEVKAKLVEAESSRDQLVSKCQADLNVQLTETNNDIQRLKGDAERKEHEFRQSMERLQEEHERAKSDLQEQLNSNDATKLLEYRLAESQKQLQDTKAELSKLKRAFADKEQFFKKERADLEAKLLESLQQQEQLVQDHSQWEAKTAAAEESHNKQFEELLGQLDLVEADHHETIAARNKIITEKESAITTLASQLADVHNKVKELEHNVAEEKDRCKAADKKQQEAVTQVRALQKEISVLKQTHEKFVEEAAKLQEDACEEAREEMIVKAEAQFQQANQHYIKLRKQFEESQLKVKRMESQLRVSKKGLDELTMEKTTIEADLNAQVAKLLAEKAKTAADVTRRAQEHQHELSEARHAMVEFEERLARAYEDRHTLQAEKDKALRDYEDMKGLSEELLTIVEAGKINGNG